MKLLEKFPLKNFTTMQLGGPSDLFGVVKSELELIAAVSWAKDNYIKYYLVGEGSNLIPSDDGFSGLVIQNQIEKFERDGHLFTIGAGNNLFKLIERLNSLGFAGMERMAGIPGTVGGAIYGCAGAYGQEIKDHLVSVNIFDGDKIRKISKSACKFGYRDSIFKKNRNWVLLEAVFRLKSGWPQDLRKISHETIKLRALKYKPGLKCPGSFFQNIKLSDFSASGRKRFLKKIPKGKIMYGKVPAGYLLDEVHAKGMGIGNIRVADHHGNLIYNQGGGKSRDVKKLSHKLKALVKRKFGITMKEEVQYL